MGNNGEKTNDPPPLSCDSKMRGQTGIICPTCFHATEHYSAFSPRKDGYGRITRSYICHCDKCERGFEVVQFLDGEKRRIYKYRGAKTVFEEVWQIINEPPLLSCDSKMRGQVPVVMTGPGGDFTNGYTPDPAKTIDLCRTMLAAMKGAVQVMDTLIKAFTESKNGKSVS